MVSHHSIDDDQVSIFDSSDKSSFDELQDVFNDLHDECLKFFRSYDKQNKIISHLESKTNTMQMELEKVKTSSTCNKCNSLELKITKLNQVIWKYKKGQIGLESSESKKRYRNDISGLEFPKFYKPSSSKIIFVKSSNASTMFNPRRCMITFNKKLLMWKIISIILKEISHLINLDAIL